MSIEIVVEAVAALAAYAAVDCSYLVGCVLRAANQFAYPDLPDEVQLLWYEQL